MNELDCIKLCMKHNYYCGSYEEKGTFYVTLDPNGDWQTHSPETIEFCGRSSELAFSKALKRLQAIDKEISTKDSQE